MQRDKATFVILFNFWYQLFHLFSKQSGIWSSQPTFSVHNDWIINFTYRIDGATISKGSKIDATIPKIPLCFNKGLKTKESSLTFRIILKTLSIGCELISKFMNLRKSSEEGIFSRITLEFDTHLFSKPKLQVLRHEISDKDSLIILFSSSKELKKSSI